MTAIRHAVCGTELPRAVGAGRAHLSTCPGSSAGVAIHHPSPRVAAPAGRPGPQLGDRPHPGPAG